MQKVKTNVRKRDKGIYEARIVIAISIFLSKKDIENGLDKNGVTAKDACNRNARIVIESTRNEEYQQVIEIMKSCSLYYVPIISTDNRPLGFYISFDGELGFDNDNNIVYMDTSITEIVWKLQKTSCLYVMNGRKLAGTLGETEVRKAFMTLGDINNITAQDICNKEFNYITFETLPDDLVKLSGFTSLPVIDNEYNLLHIMYKDAQEKLVWKLERGRFAVIF